MYHNCSAKYCTIIRQANRNTKEISDVVWCDNLLLLPILSLIMLLLLIVTITAKIAIIQTEALVVPILKYGFVIFKKCFYLWIFYSGICGCGGSSEPSVLTARSVGLKTSSMAQVGFSLEKKVSPQQVLPYLRAATSIAEVRGIAGKIKNSDSDTLKGTFSGSCCQNKTKQDSQS